MSDSKLNIRQSAGVEIVRAAGGAPLPATLQSMLNPKGQFKVEHWRNGKRINEYVFPNGITNEGKDFLFDVMFNGGTPITTWHLGLIDLAGYTALAAGDTYDNIDQAGNGWDEFTDYTDANNGASAVTRPEWPSDAAASQAITNSTVAIFTITVAGDVKGVFLVGGTNADTKGDHTSGAAHKLWATALFTVGDVAVLIGDALKVTYSVSA